MLQLIRYFKKIAVGTLYVFLAMVIPEYVKKIIFVVTVDSVLFDIKKDDYSRLSEINEQYQLLGESSALAFPVSLTRYIWNQSLVDDLIKEALQVKREEIDSVLHSHSLKEVVSRDAIPAMHLATRLACKAPLWLRYGNKESRSSDIVYSTKQKINALSMA